MVKYLIEVNEKMATLLRNESNFKKITTEELINQILNRYLVPTHTIDQGEMAEGYQAMADINLELANL